MPQVNTFQTHNTLVTIPSSIRTMYMSRSIAMQFSAPAIIPLRADEVDVALYFVDDIRPIDGRSMEERREFVAERLNLSLNEDKDELDELEFYLGDYFNVTLHGARTDREDYYLAVAPSDCAWGDMPEDDLKALAKFIAKFGKNNSLPILLHSINVESSTEGHISETLISEFVHLSEEGAKIYQQASSDNPRDVNGDGFITEMLKEDSKLNDLTPTGQKDFD